MQYDEYWNKFLEDGSVDSYLRYKNRQISEETSHNGTDTFYDKRTDNTRTEYR